MGKPDYTIVLKDKNNRTKKPFKIFSLWKNQWEGFNVKAENSYGDRPGVVGLLLSDGTQLMFIDYFVNGLPPYDADRIAAQRAKSEDDKLAKRDQEVADRLEGSIVQCDDCGEIGGSHMPSCPTNRAPPDDSDIPF